ncbi:MAG: TolC family protein [Opitutales bacterium]
MFADNGSPKAPSDPRDLLAQAIENNLGLQVERLEVGVQTDTVEAERGRFDPELGFEIGIDQVYRPRNAEDLIGSSLSFQQAPDYDGERAHFTTSLSGRTALGTRYELTGGSSRNESIYTADDSSIFDPEYSSNVRLSVTQPLLKNFGLDVNLAPVNIAKAEREAAIYETQGVIQAVMARVLRACYEVYFATENIAVKEQSIALAQTLLEANQKRVDQGRMSPIAVTQAEARIAEARAELVDAQTFQQERQARLRELTATSYDFNGPAYVFDSLGELLPLPNELEAAASYAGDMLASNADYQAVLQRAETEGIRVVFNKNQLYPEVNLRLSLGTSGLESDFGSSYSDFSEREGPDWGAAVEVRMPLGNRTAKAQYRASKKREKQALLRVKETEVQLLRALDTAVNNLKAAMQRQELIGESVQLAEAALSAEESRLANGVTTNIEVLNQQRELSVSQTEALAAEVEVHSAWLQLQLLKGRLSEQLGFALQFDLDPQS